MKSALLAKEVTPTKLHGFLEIRLDQKIEFCLTTSTTGLRVSPCYCFLNITFLENIIGEPLQHQLDEYISTPVG